MLDILEDVRDWHRSGEKIALCTVLETWGSSPRRAGAHMAVIADGRIAGSVSGGCVEGAVIQAAMESLSVDAPKLLHFGVTDDVAWEVGLACGGEIDILVFPLPSEFLAQLTTELEINGRAAYEVIVDASQNARVELNVVPLDDEKRQPCLLRENGKLRFYNPIQPGLELILIGGGHVAQALARFAALLSFPVCVIDPRATFAKLGRFPSSTNVIHGWPQDVLVPDFISRHHAVVTLSHDPKIDDPALTAALRSKAWFIGALGSHRTHLQRVSRLRMKGFSDDDLARVYGPVGFDLGAFSVEELGLEILSEIMAMRNLTSDKPYKDSIPEHAPPPG
ncbi:MAG: XdhC family protein [Chloroflexi bacterium]|nr:XdhC family protein [Chloroflexota bacterium]